MAIAAPAEAEGRGSWADMAALLSILFWEILGLQNRFYKKWIFSQSRTKTSTKTCIANRRQKLP